MVLNPFRACEGWPTFQDEYRSADYTPEFIETGSSHQIVGPDTPYVAVAGPRHLYFIDPRFRPETAAHIKAQIERASVTEDDEYIKIDEIEATASGTGQPAKQPSYSIPPMRGSCLRPASTDATQLSSYQSTGPPVIG
jgi:hypothetical protein